MLSNSAFPPPLIIKLFFSFDELYFQLVCEKYIQTELYDVFIYDKFLRFHLLFFMLQILNKVPLLLQKYPKEKNIRIENKISHHHVFFTKARI